MVYVIDMDFLNNEFLGRAKKKLLMIRLRCNQESIYLTFILVLLDLIKFFLVMFLQKFSPWEIVRHDVMYPIRFFGSVEVSPSGL